MVDFFRIGQLIVGKGAVVTYPSINAAKRASRALQSDGAIIRKLPIPQRATEKQFSLFSRMKEFFNGCTSK